MSTPDPCALNVNGICRKKGKSTHKAFVCLSPDKAAPLKFLSPA